MKTILNSTQRKQQLKRLRTLRPETIAKWGLLTPGDLLPHLTDPFKIATGEFEAKTVNSFFSTAVGRFLAIYMMPRWPRGAPTHPKTDITKDGRKGKDFEKDMSELINAIDRFVQLSAQMKFHDHAIFGKLSNKVWGIVMNKHLDHHFRQFGIYNLSL